MRCHHRIGIIIDVTIYVYGFADGGTDENVSFVFLSLSL